ncbi:hypothetical protein AAFF_G00007910 [Aldrovandia affinis]|uniref:Uncharacterized protein n=1 Tax=Aldrovandia affinis TaxID=143900 RepID=A0AAD7WZX4_9TELE|nr:hypothetical protein AAFF_G00007910 [Aldrovandia affinis]
MAKDREGVKSVQKELKGELRRAEKGYKEKIEGKLEDNSTREVWDGLKRITGQKQAGLDEGGGQDRANELNLFFNRFDVPPPPTLHLPGECPNHKLGPVHRGFREDVEGLADCITLYIRTCEESIVPTKKVRCFPNNKPWINKNIKALLNRKKRAFMAKDREGVKSVQKELKGELRRAEKGYKEKIEGKLEDNSTREVWDGLKRITGQKQAGLDEGGGQDRANELNLFFNRFDVPPPTHTPPAGRVSQRQPVTTRTVQLWSGEVEERLQDCLQITNWDLFTEDFGEDVEGLADCITLYIRTCEESIVPTKKVRCFPNNKPWINKNIKALLNRKKRAFMAKDREGVKSVQKELKGELRRAEKGYKEKIEGKLEDNSTREVWDGLKRITGQKQAGLDEGGGQDRANELNLFFNRFDVPPPHPHSTCRESVPPVVRRQPVTTRTVQLWSGEVEERLQDCLQITNWDLFTEDFGEDVEGLADCITLYIRTCEESIVPTKKVRCFPNNKPWINKNIKALLNRKKRAFMAKDREGVKSVQKELKGELRRAEKGYKEKIEGKLEDNSTREVWDGLKRITGQKQAGLDEGGGQDRANELNLFFNRFDVPPHPHSTCRESVPREYWESSALCFTETWLHGEPDSEVRRRQPVTTRTVQLWSGEVEERLQDCLQITNWDLFTEDFGEDVEGLADCITLYIRTCEESIVPTKKREYWESSALCFTETWLHGEPDSEVRSQHGLIVNPAKCQFGLPSIDFLGHHIKGVGHHKNETA